MKVDTRRVCPNLLYFNKYVLNVETVSVNANNYIYAACYKIISHALIINISSKEHRKI